MDIFKLCLLISFLLVCLYFGYRWVNNDDYGYHDDEEW